ncbi:MAG: hypothetical protein DRN71_00885 [Candidatus Nanohalarchaeota archaeon]|nr:MAG: hypothetical protein DRN71_00885 [Candidatus Nanohaloarchaeota archaeon]
MDSNDAYVRISYKYFCGFTRKYLVSTFKDLYKDIRRANITLTLVEYLSVAMAISLAVFVAMSIGGTVIAFLLLSVVAKGVSGVSAILLGLFLGFLFGVVSSGGIFMLYYTYPSVMVADRKKKIDDCLPFATLYLATISGSGTPPIAMFRALANFKEYGEISKESERIIEETDVLGVNLALAIENAANRTPSDRLRDIFWGIKSIIVVGGDIQTFLHEKAGNTMMEYKRRLAQFTQQLTMFIEMYITVVIVGSVFFMVLTTIMGSMSSGSSKLIVLLQFLITFLFLPIASFGLMILIKGISPSTKT